MIFMFPPIQKPVRTESSPEPETVSRADVLPAGAQTWLMEELRKSEGRITGPVALAARAISSSGAFDGWDEPLFAAVAIQVAQGGSDRFRGLLGDERRALDEHWPMSAALEAGVGSLKARMALSGGDTRVLADDLARGLSHDGLMVCRAETVAACDALSRLTLQRVSNSPALSVAAKVRLETAVLTRAAQPATGTPAATATPSLAPDRPRARP